MMIPSLLQTLSSARESHRSDRSPALRQRAILERCWQFKCSEMERIRGFEMNHFRSTSLVKQFPFLTVLRGDTRDCENIVVMRATKDLLLSIPRHTTQEGSHVDIDERTDIHFVLSDESIIEDAVCREESFRSHSAHSQDHYREGESIIGAIARHNVSEELSYIIRAYYGYDVVEHSSTRKWRAEVIKPAKGFTWASVMEEEQQREDNALEAEIAATFGE